MSQLPPIPPPGFDDLSAEEQQAYIDALRLRASSRQPAARELDQEDVVRRRAALVAEAEAGLASARAGRVASYSAADIKRLARSRHR